MPAPAHHHTRGPGISAVPAVHSQMLPWFRPPKPARLTLIYLPYAGGGVNELRGWAEHLPEDVALCPVHLPGREARFREPAARSMMELVRPLGTALSDLSGPYVIFGHSMGSWIGYELVRELRRIGGRLPEQLLVSARRAPGVADPWSGMHQLDDDALIDTIQARYGAIPPQVAAERGLLQLFLPTLRADLQLLETWDYQPEAPLPIPIYAFHGREDPGVPPEQMATWAGHTRRRFRQIGLAGGHFYFRGPNLEFFRELSMVLEET